jgi:short-subunit dehydrogenase
MRKRRDGLIINMSSAGGFAGTPMQGVYVASKHALEGYTETLMYEVERFGVRVAMVEPGYFHSEIAAKRILPANQIRAYNRMRNRVINDLEHKFKHAPEPHAVAEKVLDIVEGRSHTLRNPVTGYGLLGARYAKVLPEWLVFAYGRRYTGARPLRDDIPLLAALIAPIVGVLTLVGLVRRLGKDDRGN